MAMPHILSNSGIKEKPLFYLFCFCCGHHICCGHHCRFLLWLIHPWYYLPPHGYGTNIVHQRHQVETFVLSFIVVVVIIFFAVIVAYFLLWLIHHATAYRLMAMAQILSNRGIKENLCVIFCFVVVIIFVVVIVAHFLLWLVHPWYCLPPHGYGTNIV